ncbi:MAG: hypothetical protein KUG78_12320 [Kangiellaceae bacterium]|nr:hypothetical protein [Kangiellaceae bacterium]
MRLLSLLIFVLLFGCVNTSIVPLTFDNYSLPDPPIDKHLFSEDTNQLSLDLDVYTLSKEQRQRFLKIFNSEDYRKHSPYKRIQYYLLEEFKDFQFNPATLTATHAVSAKQGNCLSMAIVTKALADIANLDVSFELVATPPRYQKSGDFILISQHVRTLVFEHKQNSPPKSLFPRGSFIKIDYFPTSGTRRLRNVPVLEFHSMYFRNKAIEALTNDNDYLAFQYLKHSLTLNKAEPGTINMLALIHERAKRTHYAEQLYEYGLKYGGDNLELLSNYHQLLENANRTDEAKIIAKRLRKFKDPNPYKWINLGNKEFEEKDYSSAIYYYKKANKMADYLHEGYAGIARSYYSQGHLRSAKWAIKKAIEKSKNLRTRRNYEAEYLSYSIVPKSK